MTHKIASILALVALAGCAHDKAAEAPPAAEPAPAAEAAPPATPGLEIGGKGALVIGDAVDPRKIDAALRARQEVFAACRDEAQGMTAAFSQEMHVKFVIGPDGRVKSTELKESALAEDPVARCVQAAVTGTSFPAPRNVNVTVVYPFRFTPLG